MSVPPWSPAVQRLPNGQWQPLLLITDLVASEEEAHELAWFLLRQLDARLPDVAAQLDASTDSAAPVPTAVPKAAAAVPAPEFTSA